MRPKYWIYNFLLKICQQRLLRHGFSAYARSLRCSSDMLAGIRLPARRWFCWFFIRVFRFVHLCFALSTPNIILPVVLITRIVLGFPSRHDTFVIRNAVFYVFMFFIVNNFAINLYYHLWPSFWNYRHHTYHRLYVTFVIYFIALLDSHIVVILHVTHHTR